MNYLTYDPKSKFILDNLKKANKCINCGHFVFDVYWQKDILPARVHLETLDVVCANNYLGVNKEITLKLKHKYTCITTINETLNKILDEINNTTYQTKFASDVIAYMQNWAG